MTFIELSMVAEKTLLLSLQNKVSATLSSEKEIVSPNLSPAETTKKILELVVQLLSANPSSQMNEDHVLQVILNLKKIR